MLLRPVLFLPLLGMLYFGFTGYLSNGREELAFFEFESARTAFNQQDYFPCLRFCGMAESNDPSASGPPLLQGHCFYEMGLDPAALERYSLALSLNPSASPLPAFFENLRLGQSPVERLSLSPEELNTLCRKIGQMIMVSVPGVKLSGAKKDAIKDGLIGGVILFSHNIQSRQQISRYVSDLQSTSPTPLFIALDQEGGAVRRLRESQGFQTLPSQKALGSTNSPRLAYRFGRLSGRQLKEIGANLNLAPVVDLDHGIDEVISKYHRSLGADPKTVSRMAQKIILGMKREGILATAKHFPTQSLAVADPHQTVSSADVELSQLVRSDLVPYEDLIQKHGLDALMLSHVLYPSIDPVYPASLSKEWIQDILRHQMGYQGLVLSDDLRMNAIKQEYPLEESVVQAVNAGVDVLLVTDNLERRVMNALVGAVKAGKIKRSCIDLAYDRIMATKKKYGILLDKKELPIAETQPVPRRYVMKQSTQN